MPQQQCTGKAPTTSSIWYLSSTQVPSLYATHEPIPHTTAPKALVVAHEAVTPTRPPRIALRISQKLYLFSLHLLHTKITTAAVQGEIVVFRNTAAATSHLLSTIDSVLPQLKPYHPNHRMKVPRDATTTLWPWKELSNIGSYLWCRAPTDMQANKAPTPPRVCTTQLPAKSTMPSWNRNPCDSHTKFAKRGHSTPHITDVQIVYSINLNLSATAPEMIVAVVLENSRSTTHDIMSVAEGLPNGMSQVCLTMPCPTSQYAREPTAKSM
mmetsp:Transcript_25253/g.49684  ORF Transcript_25253/g.49684 Transcript_25253/m.49684 type:complete len:268 (-) Transcript_25253:525-1328(-)